MKSILIVEDDMPQQQALAEKLTLLGYKVLTSTNGKEGWIVLLRDHPDLILLDIMLPGGMNGFDFLEQLEKDQNLKTIPVIILTNLDTEEKVSKSIGAKDYFVKASTSIDTITDRIKELLGE